ncbi:DNA-directed RNA polymerase subunit beta [Paenibacillus darwinianus]|uniref:DNA-directed RNA polymerase subunit beta n=1 Tax=Paenibacillus darwinianus TaxID=1380763 RepID=A0A9W5S031_9BACL|nr:copper amine oxidase N-terminal domain-containing protein [Paenibacillus darwinianus]EXX86659.1 DNA-directed RNA polymerase subunit beta [Paenibacillus darwinianus]EXX86992.1 DNA-directed RNA polymerase subunit beta [Paenibacillus darwinianus]EXX91915.1 DNA-directed RNA polymerase subunit beta [Paenibacillus darwinianus]
MNALKSLKVLLITSFLALPLLTAVQPADAKGDGANRLVLQKNNAVMQFNGVQLKAAQPVTYKNGSAYLPLNGISKPFGFQLSYDVKTREAVARSPKQEIRFRTGSSYIKVDGKVVKAPGTTYSQKGYMMVPIRTWSNVTGSTIGVSGTTITIAWSSLPEATFRVQPEEIYATQTTVAYEDLATASGGLRIVDEQWEGREDVFQTAGPHTITRRVMDESSQWSEPYSVTVTVREPNQAPVADFGIEKPTYRIGERVLYTDRSYDDENAITNRKWSGNAPVFFEAGEKQVTLEVQDRHGLTSSVTQTVTVTDEVLYTRDEYNRKFTAVGQKYEMNGSEVLGYESVPYAIGDEPAQMVRSNSPERWETTGIAYDDMLTGKTRFLLYNQNGIGYNVKMYIVATNINGTSADVGIGAWGMGGPDPYTTNAGKLSTVRYLDMLNKKTPVTYTRLRPGESRVLLPEISNVPIKKDQTFSAYADIVSDKMIRYRIVVVSENDDPIDSLSSLSIMERIDKHVRGTFYNADRTIQVDKVLGGQPQRIVLGDNKVDKNLDGIDQTTGQLEWNLGNFGVLYKMTIDVAPNTLIGLNARGGHYTGAFIVNGKVVTVTDGSVLKTNSETAVLYRTGSSEERVDIVFTLASGSNLPIHMLFLPVPEQRY